MKFRPVLTLLAVAAASGQDMQTNLITSKHTPTADAPAFGTSSYFKRIFRPEPPKVALKSPVRLNDYVAGDKIELSLRNYASEAQRVRHGDCQRRAAQ